jgi:hypothetical protein
LQRVMPALGAPAVPAINLYRRANASTGGTRVYHTDPGCRYLRTVPVLTVRALRPGAPVPPALCDYCPDPGELERTL